MLVKAAQNITRTSSREVIFRERGEFSARPAENSVFLDILCGAHLPLRLADDALCEDGRRLISPTSLDQSRSDLTRTTLTLNRRALFDIRLILDEFDLDLLGGSMDVLRRVLKDNGGRIRWIGRLHQNI